ncbi:CPBP family intramembrane glutamic endopeptidase [Bacteroides sp.]|uniref:CPBP family intramembrane glutamic endopeptidase n=1 Tax=Bacteroides sp. TaxID=29523 RepID=UPI002608C101|nr:CPBP family intramembrane glutamic endopeptidase [Bacteroides sp.]MDD3039375.1 CPBP family intramembrane metalloprotease [Bacteroides sp.]
MKTSLKLILLYLIIAQIVAPILIMIPYVIYQVVTTGNISDKALEPSLLVPTLLAGQFMVVVYLWKAGYISKEKTTWSPISGLYLFLSVLAIFSCWFIELALMDFMKWLPNILEYPFEILQSSWEGILAITIIGPIFEELLFRGAITKALLQQYNPTKAILLSAFMFGIIHINPIQILPAFLTGILLAWIYYKTHSLTPCIIMHILYNSLSVYVSTQYPEAKYLDELISGTPYLITVFTSALLLIGVIWLMRQITIHYPWK